MRAWTDASRLHSLNKTPFTLLLFNATKAQFVLQRSRAKYATKVCPLIIPTHLKFIHTKLTQCYKYKALAIITT